VHRREEERREGTPRASDVLFALNEYEARRVAVRKRTQQDPVNNAEDGSVRAEAHGEHQHHERRKAGSSPQRAYRISQIAPCAVQPHNWPRLKIGNEVCTQMSTGANERGVIRKNRSRELRDGTCRSAIQSAANARMACTSSSSIASAW